MPFSYRFGPCELRPDERTLTIGGAPARLGARAFDVLLALVERAGRLVTKDELLDVVWPGLVVEENNVQTQVSTLRKLLGAQAIATIPGRGYRFAVALQEQPGNADAAVAAHALPSAPPAPPDLLNGAPLIGRDPELADILEQLRLHRLLTLHGEGGIGKTALARAAALRWHADTATPMAWVDLADADNRARVHIAVAQALQAPLGNSDDMLAALRHSVAHGPLLLVLDNAEHQAAAVAELVQALIAAAPDLRCAVTSQVPLRLPAERVFRVDPLTVPARGTPAAAAIGYGAVALFVDCAQASDRRFVWDEASCAIVIDLCTRLDGLPLAIKLAAARLPLLGLAGLRDRLSERLRLLAGAEHGAPGRHQTLRAALDWSHALLTQPEQTLLRRLGVWAGGAPLDAAVQVALDEQLDEWTAVDALGGLIDRAFVSASADEQARYRLSDTTKAYALQQLAAAGEEAALRWRHAQWCTDQMDEAYRAIWTQSDQVWLARWAPELDNVRAALAWSGKHAPELALRLIGNACFLFLLPGLAAEARAHWAALQASASTRNAAADAPVLARYWLEGSRLLWRVDEELMQSAARRAEQLYRQLGDNTGLYLSLRCRAAGTDVSAAEASVLLDEMAALEQAAWPPRLRAQRWLAVAGVLKAAGDAADECRTLEALLALADAAGMDALSAFALASLASARLGAGDLDAALQCAQRLLSGPRRLYGNHVLQALAAQASVLLLQDRPDEARAVVAEFAALSQARGWEWFALHADLWALLAARQQRWTIAAQLAGYADAQCAARGGRDAAAARLHAAVRAALAQQLNATELQALEAAGAGLDDAAVCARLLGIGAPPVSDFQNASALPAAH